MTIEQLLALVEALEARIVRLEESLERYKDQVNFQLTKDYHSGRNLGKKKS
jgi:exonuclease VII small subunit